jgi:hypothetical protein
MDIRTIPLSSLEVDPHKTFHECADSGLPIIIELPDHRRVALQPLPLIDDDSLVDELIDGNASFRALLAKSKAGPRKVFTPSATD